MKISIEEFHKLNKGAGRIPHERTEYRGEMFDSKREADYCAQLDQAKRATSLRDRVISYERQVRLPVTLNNILICCYVLDFRVHYGDGHIENVDVKGFKTEVYKIKKKLIQAQYGISILEP